MKKIKNEIIYIFLHITALPKWHMNGLYKKIMLRLLRFKTFSHLRNKYGTAIANKLRGNSIFSFDVFGKTIKMTDSDLYEYYILYLKDRIYEPPLTLRLVNILEDNSSATFIDIGAHYGYFSLIAGKWLNEKGTVISIEPNINFYNRLNRNISLNNLNNSIVTYNIGFYDTESYANMGGLNNRVTSLNKEGDVTLTTFDSFCEKENIQPDIIKIDVHGAEGNILSGMSNVLKNHVSHLFCELHYEEVMNGYTPNDIIQLLKNAGLNVYEFTQHRSEAGGQVIPISSEFLSDYADRVIYATRNPALNS